MNYDRRRERKPFPYPPETCPRDAALPRTTGEPLPPDSGHQIVQVAESPKVPGEPVVRIMATKFLIQCVMLLRNRPVPMPLAPVGNRPDCPAKTARGRLA